MKTESSKSLPSDSNTWTTIDITSLPWFPAGEKDIFDADVSSSFWIMKSLRLLFFNGVTNEDEEEELPAEEDGNSEEDESAKTEGEEAETKAISVELFTADDPLGIILIKLWI